MHQIQFLIFKMCVCGVECVSQPYLLLSNLILRDRIILKFNPRDRKSNFR